MDRSAVLDNLDRSIAAAVRCGLDVSGAQIVRSDIAARVGFPGDLYVLALVGGTGVGKSSLLNALAGALVSPPGARRPTTSTPVVWLPASRATDAGPLVAWLGGADVHTRETVPSDAVAILDLPDLDSITPDHAARVDAVLPRVDAVLWVTDPEKYQDAVLHDAYLRRWVRRLHRQALCLNKVDRLTPSEVEQVAADLARGLASEGITGLPIVLVSAHQDITPLRAWIDDGATAKAIVEGRLAANARAQILDLAATLGADPGRALAPLIPDAAREAAARATSSGILAVIDLPGLERQAVAATRHAARPRGGGPVGRIRALMERGSGLEARRADPEGYLRRWHERGSLTGAAQPIRDLVATVLPTLPPGARPGFATLADGAAVAMQLARATDRAVAGSAGRYEPPTSRAWTVIGWGQLAATAALVTGLVWLVALFAGVGRTETSLIGVPLLGPVPVPVALTVGAIAGWFVLGRILATHAGWLGRRWAARLAEHVSAEVDGVVERAALAPLEGYAAARRELWGAARDAAAPDLVPAGGPTPSRYRIATGAHTD